MRSPVSRVSAAAVLVLAIAGLALWFHESGTQYAFADFIKPILEARSAKFKATFERNGKQFATANCMELAPSRTRMELQQRPGQPVEITIADYSKGMALRIDSGTKTAVINKIVGLPRERAAMNLLEEIRSLILGAEKPDVLRESLGEKEVDGRRAVGWRFSGPGLHDSGVTATIWGDPRTGLPIRVESYYAFVGLKSTVSDFTFNVDFDETLFSLDPPAGYTVQTVQIDASPSTENDFVTLLREYSKLMNNALPESLDMYRLLRTLQARIRMGTMLPANERPSDEILRKIATGTDEEIQKIIEAEMLKKAMADRTWPMASAAPNKKDAKAAAKKALDEFTARCAGLQEMVTRGLVFAFDLPADADAHYAGRGVLRGAADKPIFWYRPKDAQKYRVIYADLSVRDADTAPRVPNAQPVARPRH